MSSVRQFQPQPASGAECAGIRDDLSAWALHALDASERASVDRHVAHCAGCRGEADRWLGVSSAIPLSLAPIEPSNDLRNRLMHRIADDQMQAVATTTPLGGRSESAAARPSTNRSSQRGRTGWGQMLVAPLVIALIAMTAWAFDLRDQVNSQGEANTPITAAADDSMLPDGVQTYGMSRESSHGRFMANPDHSNALFVAWGMDPAMQHEVWCVDQRGSEWMVASLDVSQSGDVVQPLEFEQPISGYTEIYVKSKDDGAEHVMEMDETPMITPPPVDQQRS